MGEQRILVVEDEDDQRSLVASILRTRGYLVAESDSLAAARSELERSPVDLVLSDWKLGDGEGTELLEEVRRDYPGVAFVVPPARSPGATSAC